MEKQNLNILPTGGVLPIIHCSQGDIGREFQIILYSEGIPYLLDGTEDLTIDGRKDDGNIFSYILDPVVGSTITISTEEQMTACAGNVVCEIRITKGTTIIGTCNFIIQVEEGPSNNGSLSESALQALDAIRAELQQAVEDAESYNAQSKSWAVGPSGTGSGTDTNNSKYYSEQSSNSATNSQNSANASSSSATDSKNWAVGPSGSGSGTDTNNSKYYSQQSANSASDSSGYATNSQNSANASASSATDSKNWAVGPSGSGSGTDSNNAKYYSDQSSNSATNASNSANSASSSATDSKNWAVGPSGSGSGTDSNNSKYYSEQSANSATNASNSASDANTAKLGAEAAQQKIENMTASATQLPEGSTPTVNKSEVGGVVNLAFGIPKGDTGDTGATGADGFSPEVSIGTISGGHSVTITDANHPTGQTFNVMDGEDGLGVPSGGTTGQVLAKASDTDNDTEWITPSGGGSTIYWGKYGGANYQIGTIDTGMIYEDNSGHHYNVMVVTDAKSLPLRDMGGTYSASYIYNTINMADVIWIDFPGVKHYSNSYNKFELGKATSEVTIVAEAYNNKLSITASTTNSTYEDYAPMLRIYYKGTQID